MPHEIPHYKDPDIEHGSFKVLPRTTGGYVIVDLRRSPGKRLVVDPNGNTYTWATAKEAGAVALEWNRKGFG